MTDPASWARIEAILDELLDLDRGERSVRLTELAPDSRLREHVERLLAAEDEGAAGVLDRGIAPLADRVLGDDADETPAAAGQRIGPYRVLRELGRGGMGEVLLAERAGDDFEQQVALKIVRRGLDRSEIVERFRRERRILARLRHPNIAVLHDGGATDDGLPYFAMEYVEGERITDWCDERRLGVDARVRLFEAVCGAVQYAHRNLVVHRDIKPGNVFVTADGTVKLLDFGIGKLLDSETAAETQPTQGFLTPAFAAPEQIRGEATSTSSDVFSLGMLLYVLLTGHHPHGDTSRSVEIARAIAEDDPPEPSALAGIDSTTTKASEIARRRGVEPAQLRRTLRGDLDNILAKALRKNPEERYASAEDLRADLERYRKSLPVEARAGTARYRLRRFVRRHRVGVTAGSAALAAVIAGVAGVAWQASVAARERDRARLEAARAGAVKDYLIEVFSAADPSYESGESLTAVELVERGADRIADRFAGDAEIRAEILQVLGAVMTGLAQYDRADAVLTAALEDHERRGDVEGRQETLVLLGKSAQGAGKPEVALSRYQESLDLARERFGVDDPRIIGALSAKATVLTELGRLEESGPLHAEVLERARRAYGEESESVGSAHQRLGAYQIAKGNQDAAERELRASIAAYEAAGVGGVALSDALSSLGSVLEIRDQRAEAEAMLREAVTVLRREYGERGHPDLAGALVNLGGTLMQGSLAEASGASSLAEAERCMREAADIYERCLGGDHWMLGQCLSSLSVVKTKQGDIETAGELLAESVRITRNALGDRDPRLGAPLSNLARNFLRQKRYDEAEAAYEEAVSFAREVFGDKHPNVSHPLTGFADLCSETGRFAEAERAAREGWEIRRDAFGVGNSLTVETRIQIAQILEAAGENSEASAELDGAIEDARAALPDTRTVLASALVARARRGRADGETRAAVEPLLKEALTIRREEYGEDDDRSAEIREELEQLRAADGGDLMAEPDSG